MIIKKFEAQVEKFPGRTAVKTAVRELTYGQLDEYANRVAHAIIAGSNRGAGWEAGSRQTQQVALFFEHGIDMIVGALGVLKGDNIYVPLDISYPEKRLLYFLEDSGSHLILTNHRNFPLAQQLAGRTGGKCSVLNIETIGADVPGTPVQREVSGERTAYILYTSGSTGKPKGVYQTLRNMWYYTRNWIERFSITDADRMSFFTSFTHDGAVQDIFSALLGGACLYPYSIKETSSVEALYMLLLKEKITIWHSVPSLFRFFANTLTEKDLFYDIRWVLLGGEPLREHDLMFHKSYFPKALLANVYGQTESSVSTICTISHQNTFDDVSLGQPLDETEILLVDEEGDIIETMGVGEVVVSCDYIAPGYWQSKEGSEGVFTCDDELGRLYWTGDLGRLTAEGFVKMMGRKDFQVKVRGFRVETGEIETTLLQHNAVKEVIIIAKPDGEGDNYLCAYIVSNETTSAEELRRYSSLELPDYMVPRYFIFLEKMPLNPTGKIDRQQLPEPEEVVASGSVYVAPTNETEEKVAAIWQEVLGVEKVGINDNFIELGGHSLLVISIISKIHQVFNVELQLSDVFENPTVEKLAQLVSASKETVFSAVEPAEEKEYYAVTSDQKRIFVLNQFEGIGITYNLSTITPLEGNFGLQRFEQTFQKLIKRHEAFRTSFRMLKDELVQVIHDKVDFQVLYIDVESGGRKDEKEIKKIIGDFIRPFDLSKAPMFRVGMLKLSKGKYLLLLDIHHIIADGISGSILLREFVRLYEGEELPPLKLSYRDYSEWQDNLFRSGWLEQQEAYWLDRFSGEIPVLHLPTNFPRPAVQEFAGDIVFFGLGKELTRQLYQLVRKTGITAYSVLMAMFYILLHKYTGQEDIVIGTFVAGRNHVDLENIVGLFVKTLPLRNYPTIDKPFDRFLEEVKESMVGALENQQYPFSELVRKLALKKDRSRNPLFDAAFVSQNVNALPVEEGGRGIDSKTNWFAYESKSAKFDLSFEAIESEDEILCSFQYRTKLFKRETIVLMKERFLALAACILENREKTIKELDYMVAIDKEMIKVQEFQFDF